MRDETLALQDEVTTLRQTLNYKKEHLVMLRKQLQENSLVNNYMSDSEGFMQEEETAASQEVEKYQRKLKEKELECDKAIFEMET